MLSLRVVGAARGRPGGGGQGLLSGDGATGVGRSPTPDHPPLGRAAGARHPLAVGAGDVGVGTRHQPDSARSCDLASRAVGPARGHPLGRSSCLGVGRPGLGALPRPNACPWGVRPGPATHCLWVRGGGRGDPSQTPERALLRAGFARCGGGTRASGGGGASCLGVPRPGLGALPRPTARPWGVRVGLATHWLWVRGVWAWGPVTNPTARALASSLGALWGQHEGARWGAPLPWVWGVRGWALSHARPPVLGACGRSPLTTGCGCAVRAWGPGLPWHLLPCRGSSCVVHASRICGTRWPLLLGTCPCAMVVAGGVRLWRASWPRVGVPILVRSGRSRCFGRLSRRRGAFPHPGGCRPRLYRAAARGHCACRWPLPSQGRWACSVPYLFGAPQWGPSRVPPASVLGCVRRGGLAFVDPVTHACGFLYRPSFDRGLGRCTGAVLCGRRHLPFRVGGRHAWVARVSACAGSSWPGRAGRPPGRVSPRLSFPLAVLSFFFVRPSSGWGGPCLRFFLFLVFPFFPSPSLLSRPRCLQHFVLPCPGCPGLFRPSFATDTPHLLVFLFPLSLLRSPPSCAPRPSSCLLWRSPVSGRGCPGPWRCAVCPPPLSPPPPVSCASAYWRALLPASVLCAVCVLWCRAVPPLPSPLCAVLRCLWWSGALASCCLIGLCCFWCPLLWCVPVCFAVSCGGLWCGVALRCWVRDVLCCCTLCPVLLLPVVLSCGASCALLCCAALARLLLAPVLCAPLLFCSCLLACGSVRFPPPPCMHAVPCAVWCRRAVLPFRLVFCGAVLLCSLLRVVVRCFVVSCSALCGALSPAPWVAAACCAAPLVVSSSRVVRVVVCCLVLLCVAVCCGVLCPWVLCCAALHRPVLCCCVLCCFVSLVWCSFLLCRALGRYPSPWGPALSGAVFCGVSPRCVLCALCVLPWCGGACCCSLLCFVLWLFWGVLLCVPRPARSVRCCAALCWCAWFVLLLVIETTWLNRVTAICN